MMMMMMMNVEQSVEWELAEKTEILGEKLPQYNFCPPPIPLDLTWDQTRTVVVGSRRLTAWAMAQRHFCSSQNPTSPMSYS
jgi:hypothetical protein